MCEIWVNIRSNIRNILENHGLVIVRDLDLFAFLRMMKKYLNMRLKGLG